MANVHCMLDTWSYKHTLSEYVILIAFPLQQWLQERASLLGYTYTACLVISLGILFLLSLDTCMSVGQKIRLQCT
jgi:hypothetical protein